MTTQLTESEILAKYQGYIEYHAKVIASHCPVFFGIFSREDLISAGNAQLAIFIDGGNLDKLNEGTVKMRLRGAMIDELRKFSHYSRHTKTSPMMVDEEIVVDSISFSTEGVLPSGIDFNDFISKLTKQEQRVLKMHYLQSIDFVMIAKELGVSGPRIHQVHNDALKKLRRKMRVEFQLRG